MFIGGSEDAPKLNMCATAAAPILQCFTNNVRSMPDNSMRQVHRTARLAKQFGTIRDVQGEPCGWRVEVDLNYASFARAG